MSFIIGEFLSPQLVGANVSIKTAFLRPVGFVHTDGSVGKLSGDYMMVRACRSPLQLVMTKRSDVTFRWDISLS
jgi:hypothetical protein